MLLVLSFVGSVLVFVVLSSVARVFGFRFYGFILRFYVSCFGFCLLFCVWLCVFCLCLLGLFFGLCLVGYSLVVGIV